MKNPEFDMVDFIKDYFRAVYKMHGIDIKTEQHYSDEWTAIDDQRYDGPGSPIGAGRTEQEAIDDLIEQINELDEGE
jgi:hypothetical protein